MRLEIGKPANGVPACCDLAADSHRAFAREY